MWTCPKCQTHVDPSFEVCWSCGTTVDGVEDPLFETADEAAPIYDPPVDLAKEPTGDDEELPEPPNEVVECYTAHDALEAKFLVDRLVEQGIPAITNSSSMGAMEYAVNLLTPRILVRAKDLAQARFVVEEYEHRKKRRPSAE